MALTGAQYESMRLKLRGLLSDPTQFVSESELALFMGQLALDATGSVTAAQKTQGDALLASVLSSPAYAAQPSDVVYLLQAASPVNAAVAFQGARYQQLKNQLIGALSVAGIRTAAQMLGYVASYMFPSYLGTVATRASMATNTAATSTSFMNRTGHIARENITSLQAAWANWYGNNPLGETAPAGTLTVKASVEYPAGVFTQLRWSGATSVVLASGANTLSDAAAVVIPVGATFWIRSFLTPSTNIVYSDPTVKSVQIGDLCQNAGSSDMTLGGTITDNNGNVLMPIAIVGRTNKRSLMLLGHSLPGGTNDQADATGDNGDLQRPLAPSFGTLRLACTGETVSTFVANNTRRLALAQYVTDIVIDYSAIDLIAGTTAAAIAASYATLASLFPGKRLWLGTACPALVTSTDSFATLANQTVAANEAQRQILNTNIRANGIAGYAGFIELADVVEQARSGKFQVDGTAFKYTPDGTHQTQFANKLYSYTLTP